MELLLSIALGIGLSASTGFRIFVPALLANVACMNGWITPAESFAWLGTWTAFFALLSATVVEIGAYYIPFVDNLLDTIAAPLSVVAGTLLTTSFVEIDNPVLQWGLGLIVGGGTAGLVQAGTSLLRVGSTTATGGLGNPVLSTVENVASFGLSGLAIFLPVLSLVAVASLIWWLWRRVKRYRKRRA
ncbi:DUF4126 domain-containing protein [Persicitalea jodogahamensis]|uniref:DUF4126 domain-containing protein n=1 Tax=Persicitalea jodogahamensis TaxID=402147 RepID=A0A8J3D9N5_9BACT|nr:DUF4126 domain-containing protein [Persicitalea jodogahamensis]GHB72498.1 hypothetical protein GCM10007390_28200 [Persicitalea jodogahamensis]